MSVPHGGHPSNVPAGGGIPLAVGTGSVVPNNMTLLAQLREKYEDLPGELVRRILEQVGDGQGVGSQVIPFFEPTYATCTVGSYASLSVCCL